jgi:predicted GNAT family N-acyltransferase
MEIRTPISNEEWDAYYDLRYRILREPLGKERGSERNDGDETGHHLALYEKGKLFAIARVDLQSEGVAQVRFVAVEKNVQGKGYGRKIMLACEQKAIELNCHTIILHARDYAVDFYLSLSYRLIEKSYKLFDVLQHFLMEKQLD